MSTLYSGASYLNNLNTRSGNNVKVDYWTTTNTGAKYPKPNGLVVTIQNMPVPWVTLMHRI